ncbi:MAG: Rrf2 family transcriptional regulator [Candidatus Latescibacteria bacterium]|nr:Rrf2 family transcriptional regulator [Candidatus Latescibacterota bacterium]NIM22711.1 Rrf2 family transcriptional regulator [Candidatus Latescibacterota bacterium]NIM65000.1 Rrf2 family transcriptional regulator [Candidatus Latescibacterota bacterium]NIO01515.1 Rrf2 family transcriptional regulator [Candidatus Latescibacterota bacterium]NIO28024.1 Rrf2 family transcriptional regulator [Candidatus Latescibacterota bacterium]
MRLLKTSEYAIRVLSHMARNEAERYSVSSLHRALGIPYKYLGRLMRKLTKAGLVDAARGKTGGYVITRPPGSIHLIEIVEAVEGLEDFDHCILGFEACSSDQPCPLHDQWGVQRDSIRRMLEEASLEDLALKFEEESEASD